MPPKTTKKKGTRRPRRAAKKTGIPRFPKSLSASTQYASITETAVIDSSILTNVATFWSVKLRNFPRAQTMARCFQFFRIEEVAYKYTPLFDTYQGGPAAVSMPYAYHAMDRVQSLTAQQTNIAVIQSMGAKPRRFDRPITVKYKPNTMVLANAAVTTPNAVLLQANNPAYGRWFPCLTERGAVAGADNENTLSAYDVPYNGHWFYAEQITPGTAGLFTVDVTVRVSFKDPLLYQAPAGQEPPPIVAEPIENSVRVGIKDVLVRPGLIGDTVVE